MAEGYLAWDILLLEERYRILERTVERRILRDTQDPFQQPHDQFIDTFCVSPELALELVNLLRPDLVRQRTSGLAPEYQVLAALRFYAQGSFQRSVGDQNHLNMSQTSVSRCVTAVTNSINQRLLRKWVQFPMTPAERQVARAKFANAPQPFEGAIGAIDCTHVHILAPSEHEEAFLNHYGKHSLNVQAIVDPDLKVLNINARFPGARTDASIWNQSAIRDAMQLHYDRGERDTWLIGDADYPLEPWLMNPADHYAEGTRQFAFTYQLCQARNVVERFFGVLKSVFRCLSSERVLLYRPGMVGKIVNACVVLHNMRIHRRIPMEEEDLNFPAEIHAQVGGSAVGKDAPLQRRRNGPRALGERIRAQIMMDRFPNLRDGDARPRR